MSTPRRAFLVSAVAPLAGCSYSRSEVRIHELSVENLSNDDIRVSVSVKRDSRTVFSETVTLDRRTDNSADAVVYEIGRRVTTDTSVVIKLLNSGRTREISIDDLSGGCLDVLVRISPEQAVDLFTRQTDECSQ